MDTLQKAVLDQFRELPRMLATEIVREKLAGVGQDHNQLLLDQVVEHLLAGGSDDDTEDKHVFDIESDIEGLTDLEIVFTPDDVERIQTVALEFKRDLPDLMRNIADREAAAMLRRYEKDWQAWRPFAVSESAGFRLRLEGRWGKAFDAIRMLIELSRDIGTEFHDRMKRRRSNRRAHVDVVLLHLHVRAIQIAAEIMVLMENGLADGAMARWRTLHEVTCVAILIESGGDALAERYLLHELVEARKALLEYQSCQPILGYRPFPKREAARIERDFQALKTRFGKAFTGDYGWAADYLDTAQPSFRDIEDAVGRSMLRSHYKMASQNVHAGTKGIAYRLGTLDRYAGVAGASNVGFVEPGQNLSLSLLELSLILLPARKSLDTLARRLALEKLRARIPQALARAERGIKRDEAKSSGNEVAKKP